MTPNELTLRERTLLYPGNDMEVTVDIQRRPSGQSFDQVRTLYETLTDPGRTKSTSPRITHGVALCLRLFVWGNSSGDFAVEPSNM